jgi:hypothetical protein
MKTKIYYLLMAIAVTVTTFSSCKKEESTDKTEESAVISAGAIAVGTTTSLGILSSISGVKDSVYLINCYAKRGKKDSVAFSALPTAISTYLTANYAGYTFSKAFKITDPASTLTGYVVVIKVNNNPIGLKFTATGTFVNVLEQRAGADLLGKGWHDGGPFCNRDGKCRDTIAITAIPTAVKNFFTTTYPTDTLLHAYTTRDTTYILISKNNGLYATGITPAGKLVNRTQISPRPKHIEVAAVNLPSVITSYLGTTYPGYTFNKAFSESAQNVLQAYVVFITSNSTNYAVEFSASGTFVKAKLVR